MGTESFTQIDESQLDQEWLRQPALFHKYAIKLAQAKADLAEAKAELDVTCSEVSLAIRQNPGKFGLTKLTDKGVEAATLLQREYVLALREVNRQKYRVDVYQAAVDSLEHRKRALENLVTLHGQDYFATPRVRKHVNGTVRENMGKRLRDRAFAPTRESSDDG